MARKKRFTKKKPREVSLKTTNYGEDTESEMSNSSGEGSESEKDAPSSAKRSKRSEMIGLKKEKLKERNSNKMADDDDTEFEVEKIIDDRIARGKTQYKIRWKGHPSSQDTWENEEKLNCEDLINDYLDKKNEPQLSSSNEREFSSDEEQPSKIAGNSKNKGGKKHAITKKNAVVKKQKVEEVKPDENGEFVVSRIIDMHVAKNGKHQYLVSWKGFPLSQSSWEPEENVKDTAAYERFLKRLEDAKSANYKELRVLRRPTDRFTMSTQANDRRLSRRFQNKQRQHYFDGE